jgi:transposase
VRYEHKRKERHCVFGALGESIFIRDFAERFNSTTFKGFLLKLISLFKYVVVVMDHARYHTSREMQEFYTKSKDSLHVEYFPSYSPELNPAKIPWRETKRWLSRVCWNNNDELKEQLEFAFKQDFVKIKIYDYLRN